MKYDFRIKTLGPCKIPSPKPYSTKMGDAKANYTRNDQYILRSNTIDASDGRSGLRSGMDAGGSRSQGKRSTSPPSHVNAAIVTCGGLCPGLNDVVRAITRTLWYFYGVERINGHPLRISGFRSEFNYPPKKLDPDIVDDIHNLGGTILGSSRGYGEVDPIVDALERMNINMLFTSAATAPSAAAWRFPRRLRSAA